MVNAALIGSRVPSHIRGPFRTQNNLNFLSATILAELSFCVSNILNSNRRNFRIIER